MRRASASLTWVAAFALIPGWPIAAQRRAPLTDPAYDVPVGTKVRVWMDPSPTFNPLTRRVRVRPERFVGTLLPPPGGDKVVVRATSSIVAPWADRERTFFWSEVRHFDAAEGRYGGKGAAQGAVAGLLAAALVALMSAPIACFDGCGTGPRKLFTVSAAVLVPIGAITGARATRWKRVF